MKNIFYKGLIFFFLINANLFAEDLIKKETEILKNLRCLVCQGQSVAESNSEFALTLKEVIRDRIEKGETKKQIYSFLSEKYGEWIIYKPSFSLQNFALWTVPYLFLIFGGVILFFLLKKRRN